MHPNPPCEFSGCSSTVLFFLLVLKSGDFGTEKTDKEEDMDAISSKKSNINIY